MCWPFISLRKNGQSVLVADSFEIGGLYRNKIGRLNKAIKEVMFRFLRSYAKALGIKKVALGYKGPGRYSINKYIKVEDLKTGFLSSPIQKLGGYWLDKKYFLETIGSRKVYWIT